jgi:hypothetical protein
LRPIIEQCGIGSGMEIIKYACKKQERNAPVTTDMIYMDMEETSN